jgi:comEA protein
LFSSDHKYIECYTVLFITLYYSAILGLAMARPRFWTVIIVLLVAIIVTGGIVAWQRYRPPQTIEISLTPTPEPTEEANPAEQPQKIDINRAEAWLLEALPGIGPSKAQAIIDYRQQNGGFKHITEITRVEGIGPAIYEQIKDLITVGD